MTDKQEKSTSVFILWGALVLLWVAINVVDAAGPAVLTREDGTTIYMQYPGKLSANIQRNLFWMMSAPLSILFIRRLFEVRGRAQAIVAHVVGAAIYISVSAIIHVGLWSIPVPRALRYIYYLSTRAPMTTSWFRLVLPEAMLAFGIAWAAVALSESLEMQRIRERDAAEASLRASQAEAQLAASRLATLRAQLQPHFLFNTLNGISALTESNPGAARAMLAQLSSLLRRALENEHDEIPLAQEIDWVESYLELQQARFSDRINVELNIDPAAIAAYVPNLLLQPLVENALEHGFAGHDGAFDLLVSAKRTNGSLHLSVRDNGRGLDASSQSRSRTGIGLVNTRERLSTLFGSHATLTLAPFPTGGTEATIVLPFHTSPQ